MTHEVRDKDFCDFQRLIDQSPDGIFHYDIASRKFSFCNKAFRKIFGSDDPHQVLSSKTVASRIHPEDIAGVRKAQHESLKAGLTTGEVEYRLLNDDGSIQWVHDRWVVLRDESERPIAVEGIVRDFTRQKETELALKQSEEKYRQTFHTMPDAIVITELETSRYVEVNEAFCRMIGCSREQVLGRTFSDLGILINPEIRRSIQEMLEKQGEVQGLEVEFRMMDGRRMHTILAVRPIHYEGKDCVISVLKDINRLKQVERSLRKSEERLKLALDGAEGGLWDWDIETNDLYFSSEWLKVLGYEVDEVRSRMSFWEGLVHSHDRPIVKKALIDLLTGRAEFYQNEHRVKTKSGEWKWVLDRGKVVKRNEQGRALRATGTQIDITERKHAQEALELSEAHLRTLIDTIPDLVWWKDTEGVYLHCNKRFEGFFGAKEEDIVGRTDYDFLSDELADFFRKHDNIAMIAGKPTMNEERITFADDGHEEFLETIKTPVRGGDGRLIGVLGVGRDITERKRAEEALRESEGRVRAKLEAVLSPEGGIGELELADIIDVQAIQAIMDDFYRITHLGAGLVDTKGNMLVSTGWQDICAYFHRTNPETLKNCLESDVTLSSGVEPGSFKLYKCKNNMWDVVTPITLGGSHKGNLFLGQFFFEDEEPDYAAFRTAAEKHGFDVKAYLASLDRVPRLGRESVEAVMSFYSRFADLVARLSYGSLKLARALEDRKRAEEEREKLTAQLIQAQKMESVGRLAGGVAHDFNNMLGVILGRTEMALEQVNSGQPLFAGLLEIRAAAERSAELTRQLLGFARRQTIKPRVLDLNDTVESMLKMLRRLIGEDIELDWLPYEKLCPVKIDPSQINQILANLCVNARDAIEGVGKVTLETGHASLDQIYRDAHPGFAPGDFVLLAISDNGCGMDKETMDKIFEPFFTTKGMAEGTGLGLATVYGIVKQNNGFINVYSEPKRGTTFKIYLPKHGTNADQVQQEVKATTLQTGDETILLVEDERATLNVTNAMLDRLGYRVLAAATPQEAIPGHARNERSTIG